MNNWNACLEIWNAQFTTTILFETPFESKNKSPFMESMFILKS